MTSSILDFVLLAALAGTSGAVLLMYRRLKSFDALQSTAAVAFTDAAAALDRAREAMRTLHDEGGDMAVTLAARLNEARMVMNDIDDRSIQALRVELVPPAPTAPQPAPRPAPMSAAVAEVAVAVAEAIETMPGATVTPLRPRAVEDVPARPAATLDATTHVLPLPAIAEAPSFADPAPVSVPPAPQARPVAMRAAATARATMATKAAPRTALAAAASPAIAGAVPLPAPRPVPPRVGSPTPLRAPAQRPRIEEPKPTLHRVATSAPTAAVGEAPSAAARAADLNEPTFGSRGITLADLARAARGADQKVAVRGADQKAAPRGADPSLAARTTERPLAARGTDFTLAHRGADLAHA